jgi:hypothetical protein
MKTSRLIWTLGWITMGSLASLQGCGGDDDDGGDDGSSKGGEAGESSGGSSTGGRGGTSTGGSSTGGSSTGGSSTGGAGGAPGGMGGEPSVGGEGGGGTTEDRATLCSSYCQAYYDKGCFAAAMDTYGDEQTCRDTCNSADWPDGTPGEASGNTLACRITHVGLASATMRPDMLHCGHASEDPPNTCVD